MDSLVVEYDDETCTDIKKITIAGSFCVFIIYDDNDRNKGRVIEPKI